MYEVEDVTVVDAAEFAAQPPALPAAHNYVLVGDDGVVGLVARGCGAPSAEPSASPGERPNFRVEVARGGETIDVVGFTSHVVLRAHDALTVVDVEQTVTGLAGPQARDFAEQVVARCGMATFRGPLAGMSDGFRPLAGMETQPKKEMKPCTHVFPNGEQCGKENEVTSKKRAPDCRRISPERHTFVYAP